ncbi:3-isopropylmalate dehydratase large subunit [Trinickia mobilis]|uniref:3-isopropylmalate dehydratase large subunit n=1 Tax=Trinickia mobilis TaxID=2816356 RepID=UPI001A8C235F|nr:3-isopropylmalate dehydratase large subunit [Trinickia mobilis]
MPKTLFQKILGAHRVASLNDWEDLIYIDLHLLHEINTPQAFDGLRSAGRMVRRPELTLATEDHNTPTRSVDALNSDAAVRRQVDLLRANCEEFGIRNLRLGEAGQGIVHVLAPEQGRVFPGSTLVCCDSHTTTHGAFAALALGIGTSQVEHVLATQTLRLPKARTMRMTIKNRLGDKVSAKDLALEIINRFGTGCGIGHVVEFAGEAVNALSMEGRMTLCNMSVEAGARAGIIGVDNVTIDYLRAAFAVSGRQLDPEDVARWRQYCSDDLSVFDAEMEIDAASVKERVTWGTVPSQSIGFDEPIPDIASLVGDTERQAAERAFAYMQVRPGQMLRDIRITKVFVGSCTNGRLEDLRAAAAVLAGRRVHKDVHMVVVPGSMKVCEQAIREGIDEVFIKAGVDFRRLSGCSMCVGLNEDRLSEGERSLSTSNRNFEGRQGPRAMTHIGSPAVAAATAVLGRIASPTDL